METINKIGIVGATMFLVAQTASGKIGETIAECDARYGKPTESREAKRQYNVESFTVFCWFSGGVCDGVSYWSHTDSNTVDLPDKPLSEAQVMRLLKMQAAGWSQSKKVEYGASYEGDWTTEDGKLNARVGSRTVNVETAARTARGMMQLMPGQIDAAIFKMEKNESSEP